MGHAVSLYELLVYLRNFFPGLHWKSPGTGSLFPALKQAITT